MTARECSFPPVVDSRTWNERDTPNGWPLSSRGGRSGYLVLWTILFPSAPTSDFRTGWWQADWRGGVVRPVRYLAGLAVYRFGEARATWQRFRVNRTTLRGQRNTAWRRSGSALLYIGGAVFLLVLILKFR